MDVNNDFRCKTCLGRGVWTLTEYYRDNRVWACDDHLAEVARSFEEREMRLSACTTPAFSPDARMALYDREQQRISPWMELGTAYKGEKKNKGRAVTLVVVQDHGEFRWFKVDPGMNIEVGSDHTVTLP